MKKVMNHANLAGQVLDGRYAIVKKVGEGGMSYVYLAHDVSTNERYAIKILSPNLSKDENAMARLRREAALGIRLAHPNVCHIVRMGETEDGLVYVVMPFVEGEILADRNNRMGVHPDSDDRAVHLGDRVRPAHRARAEDHPSGPEAREHHDLQAGRTARSTPS